MSENKGGMEVRLCAWVTALIHKIKLGELAWILQGILYDGSLLL
jgi:hypothetical protein